MFPASPQPTSADPAQAITQNLYPIYKEAVSKIDDPEKREVGGRISRVAFEGFATGILRLEESSGRVHLRQIPANILNACQEAKDPQEQLIQIRKIADFLVSFPSHWCISGESSTLKKMAKAWMANNPFMREFAARYQVLQLLCDKANFSYAYITVADGIEAETQLNNMIRKFDDLLEPIRRMWEDTWVDGNQVLFLFQKWKLCDIQRKIGEDKDFRAVLDLYAEESGPLGIAFKDKVYKGIDTP